METDKNTAIFHISLASDSKRKNEKGGKFWTINRDMIRYKLHFFLCIGAHGAVIPYLPVFVQTHLGLSASAFGVTILFMQFIVALSQPLLGFIVDYFNKLKVTMCIAAVGQIVLCFVLFKLPPIPDVMNNMNKTNLEARIFNIDSYNLCVKYDSQNTSDVFKMNGDFNNNKLNLDKTIHDLSTFSICNNTYFLEAINNTGTYSLCLSCENAPCFKKDERAITVNPNTNLCLHPNCTILAWLQCILVDNASNPVFTCYNSYFLEANNNPGIHLMRLACESEPCLEKNEDAVIINPNISLNFSLHPNYTTLTLLQCILAENASNVAYVSQVNSCCFDETQNMNSPELINKIPILIYFKRYQYWIFTVVLIALHICFYLLFILSDTACCESVQKFGADFGRQRMWGPVGYGVISAIGGIVSDYTHGYMVCCSILAIMSIAMLLNVFQMKLIKPKYSQNMLKDMGLVIKSKRFISFGLGAYANGIGLSIMRYYLVWFLTSIGGNNTVSGLVHTLQNLAGEVPFMFFSGWFIKRIGYFHVTTLSFFMYFVRLLWYSYLQNPWLVLPVEWIHGINYGVYYTAIVSFAKQNSVPGLETTMQAMLFATFDGLGTSSGNILTGLSIDYFGSHQTFFYASLFFGCCTIVSLAFSQLCQKNKTKSLRLS